MIYIISETIIFVKFDTTKFKLKHKIMANFDINHIKNVVLVGHTGSGKTTLIESMLFEAGLINRRGSILEKNAVQITLKLNTKKESPFFLN